MKRLFAAALIAISFNSAFAADVYFLGGLVYRSEYQDGIGRASLLMTGNPEYVVISTDQNKCDGTSCHLLGIEGDLESVLYRLVKVQEQEGQIIKYDAIPLPLTDLGLRTYVRDYESKLSKIKVSVEVKGNNHHMIPQVLILKVESNGRVRQYELKQKGRIL